MIEMMLLGFLMDSEKTGYEIKKYMENSTHYFFKTGFSSIYPKFKKLEKEGWVQVTQKIRNGKLNKVYTLTDDGRTIFLDWLKTKPEISRIRDEALLKIFFFDFLDLVLEFFDGSFGGFWRFHAFEQFDLPMQSLAEHGVIGGGIVRTKLEKLVLGVLPFIVLCILLPV